MPLIVACFFWLDPARQRNVQLTPNDVRIWRNMVERNLTVPHRIVCCTHRPDLIDFMDTVPLDLSKHVPGLCTVKLAAHKPGNIAKEGDRVLLMDIDCVVTGNLDDLIVAPDIYCRSRAFWVNPNYEQGGRRGFIQGSMQLFTVGATTFLYEDFDPRSTPSWLNRRFGGGEQAWISERMNTDYPEAGWNWIHDDLETGFWREKHGVYGAGRLVGGKMGNGVTSELPANARIVYTPGDRSPSQPEFMARHPWAREFWH